MCSTRSRQVELAAQAIIDLINARPRSPRRDEIAVIIEMIVAATLSRAPDRSASPNWTGLDEEYGPII